MLYSKPAGKGSDFYPNTIYSPLNINARPTPEAQILNIPERNILNDIAKRAGTIKTTAIFVETSVNGAKSMNGITNTVKLKVIALVMVNILGYLILKQVIKLNLLILNAILKNIYKL